MFCRFLREGIDDMPLMAEDIQGYALMIYNFFEIDDMPPMADDIQGYALMIYNFFEIDDMPPMADDIQGCALMLGENKREIGEGSARNAVGT